MRYDILENERIRNLRVDRDLSQREVAEILHVAQNTYAQYELGVQTISTEAWMRLADFYETSVDFLMGRTDVQEPYPPAKHRKDKG